MDNRLSFARSLHRQNPWSRDVDRGILQYFKSKGCQNYLDIGCGPGGMLDEAYNLGYYVQGIDGDDTVKRNLPNNVDHQQHPFSLLF